ncbi:hypothetical protein B0H14DRAFT_2639031 [Mycena olivaceomarginata]|nr:hypothetical protein B0H14DRAFT_2639031 [Mycena olivaceomarginata]
MSHQEPRLRWQGSKELGDGGAKGVNRQPMNHAKRTHGLTSHQEPRLRWQESRELGDGGAKELNRRHWYNPDKTGTRTSGPERPNKQLVRAAATPEPDPKSDEVVRKTVQCCEASSPLGVKYTINRNSVRWEQENGGKISLFNEKYSTDN